MAKKPSITASTETEAMEGEVVQPAQAVAVYTNSDVDDFGGVEQIEVERRITVPVLSLKFDPVNPRPLSVVFQIVTPIAVGRALKDDDGRRTRGGAKMEPAEVCMVKSRTGSVRQLVVGTILGTELKEGYPGDGYVGKWFHVVKYPKAPGKDYSLYEVTQIKPPVSE